MLGGAAAAGAGVLLGPAASAAARLGESGRVFNRWVGPVNGLRAPLATRRFALVGLEWAAPRRAGIELRTRRGDGSWSAWVLASVTGHEPDAPAPLSPVYGEPIWFGDADQIQLRSSEPVVGLRAHFVTRPATPSHGGSGAGEGTGTGADAGDGAVTTALRSLPLAQPVLDAGPGQPPIIARSAWSDGARPAAPPLYGAVELAFVHHTENPNGYSPGEVAPMLLAIYDYHRYVRGWFDIGYNFVIDAFGRIWEGRAGGIDQAVSGAQAGGYNEVSTGVAVLGSFSSVLPSAAALGSLNRLLAWKLSLHGVPTRGHIVVRVNPAGASFSPYRPNTRVRLPRVAGHRDGDSTDCPGNAFYYHLPVLRPRIAALAGVPARLTLDGPSRLAPDASASVHGRLTLRGGPPIAGAPVTVRPAGSEAVLAQAVTQADGSWAASVTVDRSAVLCAVHAVRPAAVSNVLDVGIVPELTLAVSPPPLVLTGTVTPARPSVTIDVYQLNGAHRRLISQRRVRTQNGQFRARPSFAGRHGQFVIVARVAAGNGTLAGVSAPLTITR